jgi:hypothetical protein
MIIPTLLVTPLANRSVIAELCLQLPLCPKQVHPSPPSETVWISLPIRGLIDPPAFPARSAVPASCKVYPIPIHPPR